MKIVDVSAVTNTNAMPIKSGTLQFMQNAHKEALNGVIKTVVDNPQTDVIYILSGCLNSSTAPIHNISAGVLYVNGEVYDFDGASFTLTGLQKAYARIETTQYTTNADPVEFTDGVSRNVHNIRKIVIENTITSSGLPEFKDFVKVGAWLKGDTKEVVCDSTYLATNFDGSGLGRLERAGWAIMNGSNGTPNDNGKVVIAYGSSYGTLGATGGEATHILTEAEMPAHTHDFRRSYDDNAQAGGGIEVSGNELGNQVSNGTDSGIFFSGGNAPHNNMQPYVVRLRIMKI